MVWALSAFQGINRFISLLFPQSRLFPTPAAAVSRFGILALPSNSNVFHFIG
jgi:hypothetical protein